MSDTQNSVFYPQSFCVLYYSVFCIILTQTAIIPLTSINQFFLLMEESCVLCEVQTETSYALSLIYLTITVCHLLLCVAVQSAQ